MTGKIPYSFKANIWKYEGHGGWYFISLPQAIAQEIRRHLKSSESGWGRLAGTAQIGNTQWDTAIWFDTKHNTYLLPVKAEVRKKEGLMEGDEVTCVVSV